MFSVACAHHLEKNFSTHNFNCVASNADVNYPVIVTRGAHKNSTRPLHFDALFDQYALVRSSNSVRRPSRPPCNRQPSPWPGSSPL